MNFLLMNFKIYFCDIWIETDYSIVSFYGTVSIHGFKFVTQAPKFKYVVTRESQKQSTFGFSSFCCISRGTFILFSDNPYFTLILLMLSSKSAPTILVLKTWIGSRP